MWKVGDLLSHRHNPDLGAGRVLRVNGNRVVVDFADAGEVLDLVADSKALKPIQLEPGAAARVEASGEQVVVDCAVGDGRWRLQDGRELSAQELWPLPLPESPAERLARGKIDTLEDFRNRLDGLRLEQLRQADGLGSFLGGRIRLYPHQLHAAEAACTSDPVRWLLADGVGLGKTVEACLIMNRLIHTGRAERVLVVAPESLTVQWLGELWRKHHQVFVLLDQQRLDDVVRDQGQDANPFEVHRRVIIALETLCDRPELISNAVAIGIDLLVVDEAHHLQRRPGHPGNPAYRAVAAIAALGRGVLLLTATPLENDTFGYLRLLQLLRPDLLPEESDLQQIIEQRLPLPPCVSATRAADIGGWPPRIGVAVELDEAAWAPLQELEDRLRAKPARTAVARQRKVAQVQRALAAPAALAGLLARKDKDLLALAERATAADPRLPWLLEQARVWRQQGDKVLVFVAHQESLDLLREQLARHAHLRVGIFHEGLSAARRDLEVARFREADGPSMLLSTECGGEGRNFEFCKRLVLYDLPWRPAVVEQRIGRLDRIGRDRPTEVLYFRPPGGLGRAIVQLYEQLGIFAGSIGSLDPQLERVAAAIADAAAGEASAPAAEHFADVLSEVTAARERIAGAAFHELHLHPYREELAPSILARVPAQLELLTAELVLRTAACFGFEVEQQRGRSTWYIELGTESLVDRLPGVPPDTRFLGTFDREEAVENEPLDFFASGHPLVEGVLQELAEGPRGRTVCLLLAGAADLFGVLGVYWQDSELVIRAVDAAGQDRPEVAEQVRRPDLVSEHVRPQEWASLPSWNAAIRRMIKRLPKDQIPQAVAAWRLRKPDP